MLSIGLVLKAPIDSNILSLCSAFNILRRLGLAELYIRDLYLILDKIRYLYMDNSDLRLAPHVW